MGEVMKDIIINGKYRVDRKIGEGGFGLVYAGTDTESNDEVAIKLMLADAGPEILETESQTYNALLGGAGIPRVRWFGQECDYYVLVYDLLGPSLEDLFNYCGPKFSLKTVLLWPTRPSRGSSIFTTRAFCTAISSQTISSWAAADKAIYCT